VTRGQAGGGEADKFGLAAGTGLLEHLAQVGPRSGERVAEAAGCRAQSVAVDDLGQERAFHPRKAGRARPRLRSGSVRNRMAASPEGGTDALPVGSGTARTPKSPRRRFTDN
jgi:hypothetical protein